MGTLMKNTCRKMGILLIFFLGFGLQGSSSSEVRGHELSSDFHGLKCNHRKYIMESYFEKYENLLNSNFQDFIAQEELSGSFRPLSDKMDHFLKLSVPRRHLIGEGSHRHLSSTVRFHLQPGLSLVPRDFCKVIIVERLPSGVFADPFELQHLLERGVFSDVAVFGDTNLELPSFLSNRSALEIHLTAGHEMLLGHMNELEITVDLPVHARYPALDDSGYSKVEFGAPDVFMCCCMQEKSGNESCVMLTNDESKTDAVVWRIPSGVRADAGIVSVVTFAAASISALLIVLTSIFYSNSSMWNKFKQS